jgi:hypothetical protein
VVSYLALSNPRPKRLCLHTLEVVTSKTIRLSASNSEKLGVTNSDYGQRNCPGTQEIGAAINFLGLDGVIAPSARWACDNLVLFPENFGPVVTLESISVGEFDWQRWGRENGLLDDL